MAARYIRVAEVRGVLGIDDAFLRDVCEEGLVEIKRTAEDEPVVSVDDAERLRLITVLMRELDVNLAGAEVILHMREDLCSMQRQFDEILRTLVEELRRRMPRPGE
jgi:MerR family transcriptional regulator/heat shock protein HspR